MESVLRSLGVFRSGTGLSAPTSSTKTPTMPAASREKAAVTPTTDAKEEVPWMSSPPNKGPTMKAKVDAAAPGQALPPVDDRDEDDDRAELEAVAQAEREAAIRARSDSMLGDFFK